MKKKCWYCKSEKPLKEYYKDKNRKDGLCAICKVCACKRAKEWRKNNLERSREGYRKYYSNNKEKRKVWTQKYIKENREKYLENKRKSYYRNKEICLIRNKEYADKNKELYKKIKKLWKLKNPIELKAQTKLQNAVKSGKINKQKECSICRKKLPKKNIYGHHKDYNKPLEVIWVCPQCHKDIHLERIAV